MRVVSPARQIANSEVISRPDTSGEIRHKTSAAGEIYRRATSFRATSAASMEDISGIYTYTYDFITGTVLYSRFSPVAGDCYRLGFTTKCRTRVEVD